MKLIVGLGNPGKEYEDTRHNIGFMAIDNYCGNIKFQSKFNGLYAQYTFNDEKVLIVKPQSYMNLSGKVVKDFTNYYKILPEDLLVIRDDLDLDIGTAKIKYDSSSGGDNGIKSIINELGTQKFTQLKIGISNDKNKDTVNYVLGHLSKEEFQKLAPIFDYSNEIIETFIREGYTSAINKYNGLMK